MMHLFFPVVSDKNVTTKDLNDGLQKSSNCGYQCKTSFNPEFRKQPQEVIVHKHIKASHPVLLFINNPVQKTSMQKHLGMIRDSRIYFGEFRGTFREKNCQ